MIKEKEESKYWADQVARRIVEKHKKKVYVLRAGLSASGVIHAGKLREPMTVHFVEKALKNLKKKTKFICYFDDFDRLRKIPSNVPKEWEKYIGMPVCWAPDPWKCHKSYAKHFIEPFKKESSKLGIKATFLLESEQYLKCVYKDEIKKALLEREELKKILNKFRETPLEEDWWPAKVFCEICKKDDTKIIDYDKEYTVTYTCKCDNKKRILNFSRKGWIKLLWRIETPMKWKFYDTVFEPWGKDHFSPGGTFDTGKEIAKSVWPFEVPELVAYNQIRLKGQGVKMSSSQGNVISPTDLLEIWPVEIIKYIYAGTRPNKEFALPIDDDFLKVYEDFYFAERIYYGKEKVSKRDEQHWKRVYEMCITPGKEMPVQPAIKTCIEFLNIFRNTDKAAEKYAEFFNIKKSKRLKQIMTCVKNWLEKYAKEDYKFELQEEPKVILKENEKKAIKDLAEFLKEKIKEEELSQELYNIAKKNNLQVPEFFKTCYKVLVNKEHGPRLAPFILAIGQEKIRKILEKV
ncbi:MAG: lysine--tRNA ligase [Candidatus Pacearchaeota archaeon]